jgi:hypothetical protein
MLLVAAAVGLGVAIGPSAAAAEVRTDSVDSAGLEAITVQFRPIAFLIDAQSGPAGQHPSGTARWRDRVDVFGGPVTCLNVTGNRATIGFENQELLPEFVKGGFIFVEDGGTPGVGRDKVRGQFTAAAPTTCPVNDVVYQTGPDGDTVTSGELTVHDAKTRQRARQECIFERAFLGLPAFRAKYGSGPFELHAMHNCIALRLLG